MIVFERLGYTIKLSSADWKGLRRRLDLSKAEYVDKEFYLIDVKCLLCKKYYIRTKFGGDCKKCPIHKAIDCEAHNDACAVLMNSFFVDIGFEFNESEIWWDEEKGKKARRQIKRLNEIMDKIEKDNGW